MSPPPISRAVWLVAPCAVSILCAAGTLEDPTRPADARTAVASPSDTGPHVQAILARGGARIAIIDGHLVRAGDRIASSDGHPIRGRLDWMTVEANLEIGRTIQLSVDRSGAERRRLLHDRLEVAAACLRRHCRGRPTSRFTGMALTRSLPGQSNPRVPPRRWPAAGGSTDDGRSPAAASMPSGCSGSAS